MDHAKTIYELRDKLQAAINDALAAGCRVNVNRTMLAGIAVSDTAKSAPVPAAPPPEPVPVEEETLAEDPPAPLAKFNPFSKKGE